MNRIFSRTRKALKNAKGKEIASSSTAVPNTHRHPLVPSHCSSFSSSDEHEEQREPMATSEPEEQIPNFDEEMGMKRKPSKMTPYLQGDLLSLLLLQSESEG